MEEFILKVRNNPCLWDSTCIFFRDNSRKYGTWETVALECGMADVTEAKTLWKRLRDSHREAMRRRKLVPTLAPWKYEELMDFLLPQSNADYNTSQSITEYNTPQSTAEYNMPQSNKEYSANYNEAEGSVNISVSEDEDIKPVIDEESTEPANNPIFLAEVHKEESLLDNLDDKKRRTELNIQRNEQRNTIISRNASTDDAITYLFSSLCQKTRMLPKHLQLRVQREVFDSVTKAEEEALKLEYPESPRPSCESRLDGTKSVIESVQAGQLKKMKNKKQRLK